MNRTRNISNNKIISSIGLGCVTFGREIDQKASFEIMDYAQEKGITFFDTAAAYGAGASERIIGAWLTMRGKNAESIIVATKILPPYTPQSIEAAVDQSLKRLGGDAIELLYLHHWDPSVEKMETLAAFDNLVRKGKVCMLGASNFTAQQLSEAVRCQTEFGFSRFRFVQNNHNFAVSDLTEEFRQICIHNQIAIVTYSPLGAGFLTGKYQSGIQGDSRLARIPGHQQIYFQENAYKRLAQLQELANQTGYDTAHLALAWAFQQEGVSSVLIGGRCRQHIDQATEALASISPDVFTT
jgi:aryl-alcohol dehydrogenase-like predicted oxidoreductase